METSFSYEPDIIHPNALHFHKKYKIYNYISLNLHRYYFIHPIEKVYEKTICTRIYGYYCQH